MTEVRSKDFTDSREGKKEKKDGGKFAKHTYHGVYCLIIRCISLMPAQELGAARGKKIKSKHHQMYLFKKYLHVSYSKVREYSSKQNQTRFQLS